MRRVSVGRPLRTLACSSALSPRPVIGLDQGRVDPTRLDPHSKG
jgi:hypothetical protein